MKRFKHFIKIKEQSMDFAEPDLDLGATKQKEKKIKK